MPTTKTTKEQRRKLKDLVIDSMLNRLSTEETIDFIDSKIHVRLSDDYIKHIKTWIRTEKQREFAKLREDKFLYVSEYMQRIAELKELQRAQHAMKREYHYNPMVVQMCLKELRNLTLDLADLYDLLPAISSVRPFDQAHFNEEMKQGKNGLSQAHAMDS